MFGSGSPSLRILVLFLIVAGVPLGAFAWLGSRFLAQDRDLEVQRQRDQLMNASELLVRELESQIQSSERWLRARTGAAPPIANGTYIRFAEAGVRERGGVALPFYPAVAVPDDPHRMQFEAIERVEFGTGGCESAVARYQRLAATATSDLRAAALMRAARCLKTLGRYDDALATYNALALLEEVVVAGSPAVLLATRQRLDLLATRGDTEGARRERERLAHLLAEGRYVIDRGTFEFLNEAAGSSAGEVRELPLALAAGAWWPRWRTESSGRAFGSFNGGAALSVWHHDAQGHASALLAPVESLFESLRPLAHTLNVAVAIDDASGATVWGALPLEAQTVVRSDRSESLPWRLRLSAADPARTVLLTTRRRTMAASGLALMVVIVSAAAFFVFRAVRRELEIARLQSEFISTVSHEFRTPLTAMHHLTSMLEEGATPAEKLPQDYAALSRETLRLHRVVEGLLDFRRFESGRTAYQMETIDPADAVRYALEGFAARAADGRLRLALSEPACAIRGDREAVAVAVSSLVDNALKYSPPDAPVSVEVAPVGAMVGISVEDRGPGISADERRRVFRTFFRGAAARDGNVKGTGIGLAIVQAVVKAHGGRLDLRSEVGRGSRFTLLLPRA